ncbi:MAG: ABC transporter permease subunit [Myxococcaceae bacterium]
MQTLSDTRTLTGFELRRAFAGGRVLAISALFLLGVAALAWALTRMHVSAPDEALEHMRPQLIATLLGTTLEGAEPWADFPLALLATVRVVFWLLPALVALLGFDQLSQELDTRSVRYFTLRVRRSAVLISKLLAQSALVAGLLALAALAAWVWLVGAFELPVQQAGVGVLRLWAALFASSLPPVVWTAFCSGLTRSAPLALALALMLSFVFWVVALANASWMPEWLTPSGWGIRLLRSPTEALSALGVLLAHAIAMGIIVWRHWERRPL